MKFVKINMLEKGEYIMSWMGWQIDYLLLLQNFREITHGVFDQFFLFISQLAVMPFTVIMICIIYWSINKRLGLYMIYCNSVSFLVNAFLKFTFCIYRPWILDSRVHPVQGAFKTAPGYSFPSGHTAGAVSFWGALGMYFKNNKIILSLCALIIFLVMLSRNYLGVHTSQDVIVSLIVGIGILFLVQRIMKKTEAEKNFDIVFLLIMTFLCVVLALYLTFKSYPLDYVNGTLLYDNTTAKYKAVAEIFNVFAIFSGCFLEAKFIRFNPEDFSIIKRILIAVIGLILLFLIDSHLYNILTAFMSHKTAGFVVRFIYGFFITFIYPCFIKGLSLLKEKCYK